MTQSGKLPQISELIRVLEHYQLRVAMFIGSSGNVDGLVMFLEGLHLGCRLLGYDYGLDVERQVFAEHGWERRATGVWLQMQDKGMDNEAIVHELLKLEIEKWKMLVAQLDSKEAL